MQAGDFPQGSCPRGGQSRPCRRQHRAAATPEAVLRARPRPARGGDGGPRRAPPRRPRLQVSLAAAGQPVRGRGRVHQPPSNWLSGGCMHDLPGEPAGPEAESWLLRKLGRLDEAETRAREVLAIEPPVCSGRASHSGGRRVRPGRSRRGHFREQLARAPSDSCPAAFPPRCSPPRDALDDGGRCGCRCAARRSSPSKTNRSPSPTRRRRSLAPRHRGPRARNRRAEGGRHGGAGAWLQLEMDQSGGFASRLHGSGLPPETLATPSRAFASADKDGRSPSRIGELLRLHISRKRSGGTGLARCSAPGRRCAARAFGLPSITGKAVSAPLSQQLHARAAAGWNDPANRGSATARACKQRFGGSVSLPGPRSCSSERPPEQARLFLGPMAGQPPVFSRSTPRVRRGTGDDVTGNVESGKLEDGRRWFGAFVRHRRGLPTLPRAQQVAYPGRPRGRVGSNRRSRWTIGGGFPR